MFYAKYDHEAELTLAQANPREDFARALTLFQETDLVRLADAMGQGQLVSGLYKLGSKRCLFGWLAGWESRQECLDYDYASKEHFLAVRRTIRAFDRGLLDLHTVAQVLAHALRERQEMHRQEQENRRKVLARLEERCGAV